MYHRSEQGGTAAQNFSRAALQAGKCSVAEHKAGGWSVRQVWRGLPEPATGLTQGQDQPPPPLQLVLVLPAWHFFAPATTPTPVQAE